MKINKRWMNLIQLGIFIAVAPFILFAIWSIATKAYEIYNNYNIRKYVLSENVKFNKALWWIRFANNVNFIDESPATSTNLSNVKFDAPKGQSISFTPFKNENEAEDVDINDIKFLSDNNEIYTYSYDYITFKKFKVTVLDDTINRKSVKIEVIMWVDWQNNPIARSRFWNKTFFIDYSTTITMRNTNK